jgi:hypothetical protein
MIRVAKMMRNAVQVANQKFQFGVVSYRAANTPDLSWHVILRP